MLILLLSSAPVEADWSITHVEDSKGRQTCLVESERLKVNDGYQDITAYITVASDRVVMHTESCMDSGYSDIGLQVDKKALIKMDALEKEKSAVFESYYPVLLEQLRTGKKVKAQLRFWPTWPATGNHFVTFDLKGFARRYEEMLECRASGQTGSSKRN